MPTTKTSPAAVHITERIVYAFRCLGALLREDDFGREDIEAGVDACLQRGFEFPTDESWYFNLSYETAPPELQTLVDDLWVATPQRNGTMIEDSTEMWTILRDVFDAKDAALLSKRLTYPLEWCGAKQVVATDEDSNPDETMIEVNIIDQLGRATTLVFNAK